MNNEIVNIVSNQPKNTSLWAYFVRSMTKNYANFKGRSRRKEFWGTTLFASIFFWLLVGISLYVSYSLRNITIYMVTFCIWTLATIIPSLSLQVRRLHDMNLSGWWLILVYVVFFFIAMAEQVFLQFSILSVIAWIIFFSINGTKGENRFGADPKAP
ncbi:DUF805 domain-containing protein [Lonepinella sp. BR2357]|uniref:DUF805 domain-containing protein n=1 Tax=Lonepinella sp. BR2357 TaxID=3434549 RepID=UPI003F6DB7F4